MSKSAYGAGPVESEEVMIMAYSFPRTSHDDLPSHWLRVNEPPPPIAQVSRNRGFTPLETYLRLLEEGRIDLNNEVKHLVVDP
jgi:hypothetical protein